MTKNLTKMDMVRNILRDNPDYSASDLRTRLQKKHGVKISRSMSFNYLYKVRKENRPQLNGVKIIQSKIKKESRPRKIIQTNTTKVFSVDDLTTLKTLINRLGKHEVVALVEIVS